MVFSVMLFANHAEAATLYISTNGNDSNACSQSAPCSSFNGALTKAANGDIVEVSGGNYSSQTITVRKTANTIIRSAVGANVTVSSLTIRGAFIEVQGPMMATGGLYILPANNLWSNPPDHITTRNVSGRSYHVVANDVLIQGGSFGGFNGCTNGQEDIGQLWQLPDSGGTYHASSRVTIDGIIHHDVTDNGNTCEGYGGQHVDCLQILAGHFITVRNSGFYNCATSNIIARPFRDTLNDLTIEGNWMGEVMYPGAALNLGSGDGGGDLFGGVNVVRFNTILGGVAAGCRPAGCLNYDRNIISIGSCPGNTQFTNNVFALSWSATCGTGAKKGMPSFVGPTPNPSYLNGIRPNYALATNDTIAKNFAGFEMFGGATPPPPPPPPADTTAPTISITAPVNNATVSGNVTVSANASDNVGVAGVQFRLDGSNLGSEDTSSPYSISWNTSQASNGSHGLSAVARDAAGNTMATFATNVTVSNVTTPPPPSTDTTAPTVSITAPANGASFLTTSGSVTVSANATDNVGVTSVQFKLDGANLGAADTTASYQVSLNPSTLSVGNHTISAVASDAAGNTGTASNRTITITSPTPTPPPSAKFTIGQQVQASSGVNVRQTAAGTLLGTQNMGAVGTVTAGPISALFNGVNVVWWTINFSSGVDGWVGDDNLISYGSPTPTPTIITGDFNQDGLVNSIDLSLMTTYWNQNNGTYDLNHDGIVNSLDYVIMVQNWSA